MLRMSIIMLIAMIMMIIIMMIIMLMITMEIKNDKNIDSTNSCKAYENGHPMLHMTTLYIVARPESIWCTQQGAPI